MGRKANRRHCRRSYYKYKTKRDLEEIITVCKDVIARKEYAREEEWNENIKKSAKDAGQ